ncbi:Na+/H+ antiporter subunit C [Hyphomicrobiaceae bacterium 22]|uniref:Na+/H+ antiporter subunit C n=1 Tax=Prosthecodimorpha staleyi TaxID=2840188 RepID=A0A947D084_9HYPH|nr:Na+/H+ antiporter subunit C [Prosthecodimorpha staleyi]
MEILVAAAIGLTTATGLTMMLRGSTFPVIVGLTFLSYAVNLFLFAMGRLAANRAPIVGTVPDPVDPLPQALVLTAIVISFGMTALIVVLALRGFLETGSDAVDLDRGDADDDDDLADEAPVSAPEPVAASEQANRFFREPPAPASTPALARSAAPEGRA